MSIRRIARCAAITVSMMTVVVCPVLAEDSLDAARQLYAAAAYDDALAVLDRVQRTLPPETSAAALEQQRALCLLALNRTADAERAIAAAVEADPLYLPDESTASPRVRSAFQDVRVRALPGIARTVFERGRENYGRKDYARASADFELTLAVTSQIAAAGHSDQTLNDVRMLAEGFQALTAAALAPPPAPPAPVAPVEEGVSVGRIYDANSPGVTPPSVGKQTVPEWRPAMGRPPSRDGLLAVIIDERGAIETAEIVRPLGDAYDRLLLNAVNEWSYLPATLEGAPVKFRKTIRLTVR
jgi:tetratricopeptide (TPR) repeat protein